MTYTAQHISITVNRTPDATYTYASDPKNLPEWASGLSGSIKREGESWIADSPMGRVRIQFAPQNSFGVLDHLVTLPNGDVFDNPMRVIPNEKGSEVIFTLYKRPKMSEQELKNDAAQIATDLAKLKRILEAKN